MGVGVSAWTASGSSCIGSGVDSGSAVGVGVGSSVDSEVTSTSGSGVVSGTSVGAGVSSCVSFAVVSDCSGSVTSSAKAGSEVVTSRDAANNKLAAFLNMRFSPLFICRFFYLVTVMVILCPIFLPVESITSTIRRFVPGVVAFQVMTLLALKSCRRYHLSSVLSLMINL